MTPYRFARNLGFAFIYAGSAIACSGNEPPPSVVAGVRIVYSEEPRSPRFEVDNAHLQAAARALTNLLGHQVTLRIDRALMPYTDDWRNDALATALESAARGFSRAQKEYPEAFAHAAPLITRIECRYTASAREPSGSFDAGTRVLTIRVPSGNDILPAGTIEQSLAAEYTQYLSEKYAKISPEDVPEAEREAYFAYLLHGAHDAKDYDEGTTLEKMVRLAKVVDKKSPLAKDIASHLVERHYYFTLEYENHGDRIRSMGDLDPFRAAEAAWVSWAGNALPTMDADNKKQLVRVLYAETDRDPQPFAAFDRPGYAMTLADQWGKAGFPRTDGKDEYAVIDQALCPRAEVDAELRHERSSGCATSLWRRAVLGHESWLVPALASRDDRLTITAAANVADDHQAQIVMPFMEMIDGNDRLWRAAMKVMIADYAREPSREAQLMDYAVRNWRTHPERRGAALLLIAAAESRREGQLSEQDAKDLPKTLGSPIGAQDLSAYLDQGPRAMALLPLMWPAIDEKRAVTPILAHMDDFLSSPESKGTGRGEPERGLQEIVDRVCTSGDFEGLARISAYLKARAQKNADESHRLGTAISATEISACRARRLKPKSTEGRDF